MKDYATSLIIVAPFPSNSGTTITVTPGQGSRFGDVPFKATVHPEGHMPTLDNAEKVRVIAKDGDTFTLERALSPTTAKNIMAGDRISNSLFYEDFEEMMAYAQTPGAPGVDGTDGDPGREVELVSDGTNIKYRYVGDDSWINIIPVASLKGAAGANGQEVNLQKTATHIQWRLGSGSWTNLVALADLKGATGTTGLPGKSAYQSAVDNGFVGTESEWLSSLDADKNFTVNINGQNDLTVTHNLGKYPAITIINSAYEEVEGTYTHLSTNQAQLHFDLTFSGKAIFN